MLFRIFLFFLCLSNVWMFQHYICKSLDLIKDHGIKYKIDESHNEIHSKEVLYYGNYLIKDYTLSDTEKRILILGCLFHDVVDKKYLKEDNNPQDILYEMLTQVESDEKIISDTTLFINNMSYSKTVQYDNKFEPFFTEPELIQSHENKRMYHFIRNADLLSSYNLRRAFLYHYVKYPNMNFPVIWNDVLSLYLRRMKKLRINGILDLSNKNCDILSEQLEKESDKRIRTFCNYSFSNALEHFNMLPVISDIDLISNF